PWFSWEDCGAAGDLLATLGSREGQFAHWQQNAIRRGAFFERERCLDIIQQALEDLVVDPSLSRTRASLAFEIRAKSPIAAGAALLHPKYGTAPTDARTEQPSGRTTMQILVTGGAGYVGSTLVPLLLGRGHRVRVLDSLRFGGHGLLPCCQDRSFELIKADI